VHQTVKPYPRPLRPTTRAAPASSEVDTCALLETVNSASQQVAVLHIAFMAVCAYAMVIVFGTTDLDLLIGKGVKLPVIDVEVPIVGFYAAAPFLVVLVHFNLLLQLQLFSRKLYAFDKAAPRKEALGGLRERLHIFPYTYYLAGRPSRLVRMLIGLLVSTTLVVLPIVTLLALQIGFLAYQSEGVTWAQRVAVLLDIALIAVLWPIIMHPRDDWRGYWRQLGKIYLSSRWRLLPWTAMIAGSVLVLFSVDPIMVGSGAAILAITAIWAGLVIPLLTLLRTRRGPSTFALRRARERLVFGVSLLGLIALAFIASSPHMPQDFDPTPILLLALLLLLGTPALLCGRPRIPKGHLSLLMALVIATWLPFAIMVDGERMERMLMTDQPHFDLKLTPVKVVEGEQTPEFTLKNCSGRSVSLIACALLGPQRRLDLQEQPLFAKPLDPEVLAMVREGKWDEVHNRTLPLNLVGRSLRGAQLQNATMIGADLREAEFQGADLRGAKLQGADLRGTNLRGAVLSPPSLLSLLGFQGLGAQFQGANLGLAKLQGANLFRVDFRGADLHGAKLQGADLRGAELLGANLFAAELQGADLRAAKLQGADLRGAELQGANLPSAGLQGADLSDAQLQGADLSKANLKGANGLPKGDWLDTRSIQKTPLSKKEVAAILSELQRSKLEKHKLDIIEARLRGASQPDARLPDLGICFAEASSPLSCRVDPDKPEKLKLEEFRKQVHQQLGELACADSDTARGIDRQTSRDNQSLRFQLDRILGKRLLEAEKAGASGNCPGLLGLSAEIKEKLRIAAYQQLGERACENPDTAHTIFAQSVDGDLQSSRLQLHRILGKRLLEAEKAGASGDCPGLLGLSAEFKEQLRTAAHPKK